MAHHPLSKNLPFLGSNYEENKAIPCKILPLFTVKLFKTFIYAFLFHSTFFLFFCFPLH